MVQKVAVGSQIQTRVRPSSHNLVAVEAALDSNGSRNGLSHDLEKLLNPIFCVTQLKWW